jgi:hypothetical protein
MKIEKNKIVFGSTILVIVLFIISYALMVMENGDNAEKSLDGTEVPQLKDEQKEFNSKLEAVDNIPEERVKNVPSVYNEKYLDSTGLFDLNHLDLEKQRIVDSIYSQGRIDYSEGGYREKETLEAKPKTPIVPDTLEIEVPEPVSTKELAIEHQLFFASAPRTNPVSIAPNVHEVQVEVAGNQVLRTNGRIQMRLLHGIELGKQSIPKNTLIYGTVSFGPNRTLIKITNIDHIPVSLKAYDLQDGMEGIYVENSFKGEVANEVVDDLLGDINIAGVPQVSGIKKVFQRSNKSVKVAVSNNYRLLLKVGPTK